MNKETSMNEGKSMIEGKSRKDSKPMKGSFTVLLKRDIIRTMSLRTALIWISLSGIVIFFFFAAGGKTELIENDRVGFMSVFLPQIIFGSWAVLSAYFDLISSEREHNVLDCILSSGVSKTFVFASKILTTMILSLILSLIYLTPVTCVILAISGELYHLQVLAMYLLPLWGSIMVYATLGVMISVTARSSKAAMILSLAIGLLLMPRIFVMIIDGAGAIFHWTEELKNYISFISPGVMINALADRSRPFNQALAAVIFSVSVVCFSIIAYGVFRKQDEYNYGE